MKAALGAVIRESREKLTAFAQLDLSFRDEMGQPTHDYRFELGAVLNGKDASTSIAAHTHKNQIPPN